MDLTQLHYFQVAAKTEHFTKAAEELHITQPALSKVILKMEEELDTRLFDREGRRIYLNNNGRIVLRHAEQIFAALDTMKLELDNGNGELSGGLNVGSSFPIREPDWILECFHQFLNTYPNVRMRIAQQNVTSLRESLLKRELDFAITTSSIISPSIDWTYLFEEKMGIILSKHHPLAARDTITMSDLKHESFLCYNTNSDTQELTYTFCALAGFQPNIYFEGYFTNYISDCISKGKGVSFISERSFYHQKQNLDTVLYPWKDDIVFRLVEDEYCKRDCGIALLKERYMPATVQRFYDFLLGHFSDSVRL